MKKGKVELYINETLESKGAMLFSLIDPIDYESKDTIVKTAKSLVEGGTDAVLIGGSTEVQGEFLDEIAKEIKDFVDVPLILFPGNISSITKYADAIYFMSMLNARNPYWIIQAQMLSGTTIKKFSIEPLPVGYIVVAPGGTVGWVGDANLVPREKPKLAASLALAGEFLGNRFIITDTGSNPRLQNSGHVPVEMIRAVKSTITIPYIVAGGILTPNDMRRVYQSGADIVQIGTAFEDADHVLNKIRAFAKVVREEGKKKL
ncbi:MAG: geranylgeranylglyceryl/heptaprenylglyceryl phosphate synthase [Candidatus Marsarchaeota archaeon]|nr:geranylgeranylglyceryl/heptaprenylglyceryl phosphate synthase [Candidatus Marsarchaeota archaeon]MCL5419104.1 geranylgeranylglyceryl/heptaprenylglyceryl phosphate synthase [Candidatus Marsarchaeota archaeon]